MARYYILYENKELGEDGFYAIYPSLKELQVDLDQFIGDGLETEYIESLKIADLVAVRSIKVKITRTAIIHKPLDKTKE